MLSAAVLLSLSLQCSPTIHPDTISDVAKTESGFNPYAIAEIVPLPGGGSRVVTHMPSSEDDAVKIVEKIKKDKHRYSVGLMQITSTNFSLFRTDARSLFNPCHNLSVAEKILADCYIRGKTLRRALSCYYSGNFDTGLKKEPSFKNTSYVQRIGYVVPSTKEDKKTQEERTDENQNTDSNVIYPGNIIRGKLPESPKSSTTILFPQTVLRGELISTSDKTKEIQ